MCHVENARYQSRVIPNARYVELPGADHVPWFEPDRTIEEIREFMTGRRVPAAPDRVLMTVLFTDIVGSTGRAIEMGDHRWRDLLEAHGAEVRAQLERFRGVEVNTAGDGFLATFDGPARAIQCGKEIAERTAAVGPGRPGRGPYR